MLNLDKYRIKNRKEAIYIPILDIKPFYAAKALTKEDLRLSYDILKKIFREIREGKVSYKVLADSILDSIENFMWYISFFKEMQNILEDEENFEIPYDKCPKKNNCKGVPEFQFPFKMISPTKLRYLKNLTNIKDPINMYRTQYIIAQYDIDDFQDETYPAWYLIKDTVVYEQYNEKTNVRVRITFLGGQFRYYISGASDNWQEITGVPLDMDHVVSALLFKNYSSS